VTDPIISEFARACGASAPLDLRVDLAEGGVLAEGSVPMPFALVGRDDACDVTLTDAEVNPRHAWLQVLAGRVFVVDLGSRTGLGWPDGHTGSGWMEHETPVRVGPFLVRLRAEVTDAGALLPAGYHPLQSDPNCLHSHPTVSLEFRNGKRAKDRWTVNRLVTLVGRAPECKIHLTADDIAGYHCGLVLTASGLWVVDLSARGVVINGERMRVSPLRPGAELWVGRFLIGVSYPDPRAHPGSVRTVTVAPPETPVGVSAASMDCGGAQSPSRMAEIPEDEVPLGLESVAEAQAGLPSSHIMADVFRLWTPGRGNGSHPIAVGGSGAVGPPELPQLAENSPRPPAPPPLPAPPPAESTSEAAAVLRQLADIHAQVFTHFQNAILLMVRLFGCLRKEEVPAMQHEICRIQELNAELARLQGEVAQRAEEAAAKPPAEGTQPAHSAAASTPMPSGEQLDGSDATALQDWVIERINSLQRERQSRWQALVGLVGGKSA
jgi:pSer/pThr/pTyr-binding forkhead associated (FHA) protein